MGPLLLLLLLLLLLFLYPFKRRIELLRTTLEDSTLTSSSDGSIWQSIQSRPEATENKRNPNNIHDDEAQWRAFGGDNLSLSLQQQHQTPFFLPFFFWLCRKRHLFLVFPFFLLLIGFSNNNKRNSTRRRRRAWHILIRNNNKTLITSTRDIFPSKGEEEEEEEEEEKGKRELNYDVYTDPPPIIFP